MSYLGITLYEVKFIFINIYYLCNIILITSNSILLNILIVSLLYCNTNMSANTNHIL